MTLIGLLSIIIVKLPRIPITGENETSTAILGIADLFRAVLPYSAFETLNNGTFLIASYAFAILIGIETCVDQVVFRPVTTLADSLSKLMYTISVIFTEFLAYGMIAILCFWTIKFRTIITS